MGAEDGARLFGSVADESHLSPIKKSVVDAGGDNVGTDGLELVSGRGEKGCVALHAAGVNHRTDHAFVCRMLGVELGSHALQCRHGEQRDAEGIADALGSADADAEARIATRAGGDTDGVELAGSDAAHGVEPANEGRELRRVGIGLVGMEFGHDAFIADKRDGADRRGGFDKKDVHVI